MLTLAAPTPRVRAILRTYPDDAQLVSSLLTEGPDGSLHLDRPSDRAPFLAVIRTPDGEYRGEGRMPSDAVASALRGMAA